MFNKTISYVCVNIFAAEKQQMLHIHIFVVYVFLLFDHVFLLLLEAATLTEVFPCFFLGCKANDRYN